VVTGNPVRKEFSLVKPKSAGGSGKRLLVIGGSQGASVINHAMLEALPRLVASVASGGSAAAPGALSITHQTGERDLQAVTEAYRASGLRPEDFDVKPFIAAMPSAFEQADLIVSRCGSTSLAELTVAGRPSVLVPFAAATHDHQTFNARKLGEAGAAVVIAERDLTGETLADAILGLLDDPVRLDRMAAASRTLGRPDAAARIVDLCLELVARRGAS
jgi:UDP-N-acetylglucosamine--N-acetylmuramyl-(pentapeptide) pyrophosphoryl-undecaprenol N-acetylglucosamine transferase